MELDESFVLDASVVINLLGTGAPREILKTSPGTFLVTQQVAREVKKNPIDGSEASGALIPLLEGGYIREVPLDDMMWNLFWEFVAADPPDDLDDGEASVIACAAGIGCGVVIDERKGRRICRERFPSMTTLCSIDLFKRCLDGQQADPEDVCKWMGNAREKSHMRIPFEHKPWVTSVLERSHPRLSSSSIARTTARCAALGRSPRHRAGP